VIRASLLLATVWVAGCHGVTTGLWGSGCSTAEAEALAGARAAWSLELRHGGLYRDEDAEQRMARIGECLCRHCACLAGRYQFRLLNSWRANAFSLPGGRVYITRGLYARLESDEQLAAVIAHEMGHLTARDHFKPRCADRGEAFEREACADARGVRYLEASGIRTEAMVEVVRLVGSVQPAGWSDRRVRLIRRSGEAGDLPAS